MCPWLVSLLALAPSGPAITPSAPAAPPVRLAALLEEARQKNPSIQEARERARANDEAVAPAGALDDPMLMVQLWNMPVDLSTIPVMATVTQPLPLGGKRAARGDEARAMAEAARAGITTRARDVESEVAKAYFDLFLAERTMQVDDEIAGTLRSLVGAASARLGAGRGEESEVLRAQSEALKIESDREAAQARRRGAAARLVALLDRAPGSELGPTIAPGLLHQLPTEEALRQQALRQRPELAGAAAERRAAEARLAGARAEGVPDLGLSLGEMHMFRGMASPADFLFLGVQGNLPIFGGKNRGRVASAASGVSAASAGERALANRVLAEIADAYAEVQAESREIELHHHLIPLSREAVTSAMASYASGRGGFTMVLDAERDLQMHEIDLAMRLAAYAGRLVELERAVGGPVGLLQAAEGGPDGLHQEQTP